MDRLEPCQNQLQKLFALGQVLTQDREAAKQLLIPALLHAACWQANIAHRSWHRQFVDTPQARWRWDPPTATRYQIGLYQASEAWERQQESEKGLSRLDFDIRYIKRLVYGTLIRGAPYVAIAIGCRLYRYSPTQLERLVHAVFNFQDPAYFRKQVDKVVITDRFPQLATPKGEKRASASVRELTVTEHAFVVRLLGLLAPWEPPHPATQTPLTTLFTQPLQTSEGEQIHVLIDTQAPCQGFAGLITAYNQDSQRHNKKMFPAPDTQLKLSQLPGASPGNPPGGSSGRDPFATTPLSPEELAYFEGTLRLLQQRYTRYRPGLLSVHVDGTPVQEFDGRTRHAVRLRVSRTASTIEVYGYDDAGPLLLAVFSVARVASVAVGRTVAFLLSVASQEEGIPSKAIVELTYLESPLATVHTLWAYGKQQSRRLLQGLTWSAIIAATAGMRGCQRAVQSGEWWLSSALGRLLAPAVVAAGLVVLTLRLFPWVPPGPSVEAPGRTMRGGDEQRTEAAKTLRDLAVQGYNYERAGDKTKAIATYQDALDQVAYPLHRLAWLYYEQGKADEGLPLARLAVQLQPEATDYLHTLAMILCTIGKQEEATQIMERATHLQPEKFQETLTRFQRGACQ